MKKQYFFVVDQMKDWPVVQSLLPEQQTAVDHPGEVSQVEGVVGLSRGGQQVLHGLLVHLGGDRRAR